MLVCIRREGESIIIGDSIAVKVIESNGNNMRMGIYGPRNLAIAASAKKMDYVLEFNETTPANLDYDSYWEIDIAREEVVALDSNIEVSAQNNCKCIGISAPREIEVAREEIYPAAFPDLLKARDGIELKNVDWILELNPAA